MGASFSLLLAMVRAVFSLVATSAGIAAIGYISLIAYRAHRAAAPVPSALAATSRASIADDVTGMNGARVAEVVYPLDEEDVIAAVNKARRLGVPLAVRGQAHTMGGHTVPGSDGNGIVLDMRFLARVTDLRIAPGGAGGDGRGHGVGTVTVEAGATWSDVIRALDPHGLCPRTLQSYSSFSVGGSLAVNAHGITNDYSMSEAVVELRVVDATGAVRVVRPGDELFGLIVGGFGLFGVVVTATLRVDTNCVLSLDTGSMHPAEFNERYAAICSDPTVDVKLVRINILDPTQLFYYVFRRVDNPPPAGPGSGRGAGSRGSSSGSGKAAADAVQHSSETGGVITSVARHERHMGALSRFLYKWAIPTTGMQRFRFTMESLLHRPLDWTGAAHRNSLMYESATPMQMLYNPFDASSIDATHILQEFFVPWAAAAGSGSTTVGRAPPGSHTAWERWHAHLKDVLASHFAHDRHIRLLNITIRRILVDRTTALPYAPAAPSGAQAHAALVAAGAATASADSAPAVSDGRDSMLAFVLYYRTPRTTAADAELAQMHRRLASKAMELGGTFYLPYRHHYSRAEMLTAYPGAPAFFEAKLRCDPHEVFANSWYLDYSRRVLTDEQRVAARAEGEVAERGRIAAAAPLAASAGAGAAPEPLAAFAAMGITASLISADEVAEVKAAVAAAAAAPAAAPPSTPEERLAALERMLTVALRREDSYARLFADSGLRAGLKTFFSTVFCIEPATAAYQMVSAALADAAEATAAVGSSGGATAAATSASGSHVPLLRTPSGGIDSTSLLASGASGSAGGGSGSSTLAPRDADVYARIMAQLATRRSSIFGKTRLAWRSLNQVFRTRAQVGGEAAAVLQQLGCHNKLNGWVAIGDPGRYVRSLRSSLLISGPQYIVHDSVNDRDPLVMIERSSIAPVGVHVPIDYATGLLPGVPSGDLLDRLLVSGLVATEVAAASSAPSSSTAAAAPTTPRVPGASVDLVTMMQGLHHMDPTTAMPALLLQVHAMLRPGGYFIIREHNAVPGILPLIDLAHSTFNAITGVDTVSEATEIRAFRPVKEWRRIVEAAGFVDTRVYSTQEDDPTVDFMMTFRKPHATESAGLTPPLLTADLLPSFVPLLAAAAAVGPGTAPAAASPRPRTLRELGATRGSLVGVGGSAGKFGDTRRAPAPILAALRSRVSQLPPAAPGTRLELTSVRDRLPAATWMTLTEWLLVDTPARYSRFLERTAWFDYNYPAAIAQFWSLVWKESVIAYKRFGFRVGILNEYTIMNAVIGFMLTLIFAQFWLLAIIPRWATSMSPAGTDLHIQMIVAYSPTPRGGSGGGESGGASATPPDLAALDAAIEILLPWSREGGAAATAAGGAGAGAGAVPTPSVGDDDRFYAYIVIPRYKPATRIMRALARAGVQLILMGGHDVTQVRLVVQTDEQVAWLRSRGRGRVVSAVLPAPSEHATATAAAAASTPSAAAAAVAPSSDVEYLFDFTDVNLPEHREVSLAVAVPALSNFLLELDASVKPGDVRVAAGTVAVPLDSPPQVVPRVHIHDY